MTFKSSLAFWAGVLGALPGTATATVKTPAIFGDHMVLQQGLKLNVWGTADPGEKVSVSFAGHSAQAVADTERQWRVQLDPLPTSTSGTGLHISGATNKIDFEDVLVGDVWVCSGQSNMEFGIRRADNAVESIASANQPEVRLFLVNKTAAIKPAPDCEGKWMVCTPQTLGQCAWSGFSAIGYFFGKEIHESRKIPIGLIETAFGGTPAQAWTSLEALESNPVLKHFADTVTDNVKNTAQLKEKFDQKTLPQWQKQQDAWDAEFGTAHNAAMAEWKKEVDRAKAAGQPNPPEPATAKPTPKKPTFFADSASTPTTLFNAMIYPLLPYRIKGVIWYQGEANGGRVDAAKQYATLFPVLIADWRRRWGIGDFPFLFVQLAGYSAGAAYPELRDSQTSTLSLANTGMAVALDVGEATDIHPKNKLSVAHRLSLAARHVAYGEDIPYSGPMYAGMKVDGSTARVSFHHVDGGLKIGVPPSSDPKRPEAKPADHLEGFEIAGADGKFVPANARIDGDTVAATAVEVPTPVAVRYGWKPYAEVNLYNQAGLPASPFNSPSTPIIP